MAVLALFTPLTKNRKSFTSNLLLNSAFVTDFRADSQSPLTKTLLYYDYNGQTWEFLLSHYWNVVSTRLFEDATNPFIVMDVLAYKDGFSREKPNASGAARRWRVNSENILFAYDISTTQSYVYVRRGTSVLRLLTSHVVADISRSYSRSASLSKS